MAAGVVRMSAWWQQLHRQAGLAIGLSAAEGFQAVGYSNVFASERQSVNSKPHWHVGRCGELAVSFA